MDFGYHHIQIYNCPHKIFFDKKYQIFRLFFVIYKVYIQTNKCEIKSLNTLYIQIK